MKIFDVLKDTARVCCDKIVKYAPEIMTGFGIAGVATGVVVACIATTKVGDVIDEAKEQLEDLHTGEDLLDACDISEEERSEALTSIKKGITSTYLRTGWELTKLYGPAVIIEGLSIASIICASGIYRKRFAGVAAAYTALDAGFKAYRKRVADRFGDEIENEIRYDIHDEKVEETITDPETGKTKKVKKTEKIANVVDDFSVVYDASTSKAWDPDDDYNEMYLRAQESFANDLLRSRGHVFLNEIKDHLGMERDKAGQIVGWVYKPKDPDWKGDNYISFRTKKVKMNTDNGYKTRIVLDFNVDGNVLDLI